MFDMTMYRYCIALCDLKHLTVGPNGFKKKTVFSKKKKNCKNAQNCLVSR